MRRACGSGRTSRLLHPFLKERELFAKVGSLFCGGQRIITIARIQTKNGV